MLLYVVLFISYLCGSFVFCMYMYYILYISSIGLSLQALLQECRYHNITHYFHRYQLILK